MVPITIGNKPYVVKFSHLQLDEKRSTIAEVINPETGRGVQGIAYCHTHDQFCKRKGRKVAFGKAIRAILPRAGRRAPEPRRQVWQSYFREMPQDCA